MPRIARMTVAAAMLLAALAGTAGCQPSVTSQLEAGLPQTTARPTTMPNEVGKDADKAATQLMDSQVKVRVSVPARTIPAGRSQSGGQIFAVTVNPVVVDLTQADQRFAGFKVASQDPAAGAALAASQTVVLTVGAHPKALPGATWYATHWKDDKRYGDASCLDSGSGGQTGCHTQSYCASCHVRARKELPPASPH